jgi:hypothetical protein
MYGLASTRYKLEGCGAGLAGGSYAGRDVAPDLDRQFDLNFPNGRARGPISVQCLPVELDGFLGASSEVLYRISCDHNGREFGDVSAIVGAVAFNDQRVRSDHLFSLLDTSLPQNGTIGAGSNVVAEFPRHDGNPALGVLEHSMVARGPNVDAGNFAVLLGATVVPVNRLFWRKMYGLASTRYKLEG